MTIIQATGGYELALVGSAEEKRKALLKAADATPIVDSPSSQAEAFALLSEIKGWLKQVEESREQVKKPVLDIGRRIDRLAKDHCTALEAAAAGLQAMLETYHDQEKIRLIEDQKRKDEEIEFQQRIESEAKWEEEQAKKLLDRPDATEEDLQRAADAEEDRINIEKQTLATMRTPVIREVSKPAGMTVRPTIKWEITDAELLFKAMPNFFRLEPNRALINASVGAKTNLPGLKVWEETKITTRTSV